MNWNELVSSNFITTVHRITIDNVQYTSDIFKSFPSFIHETEQWIGGFPAKTVEFEIFDRTEKFDLLNKEVLIERGHKNSKGVIEWFKTGYFTITETTSNKTSKSIKCKGSDRSLKFNQKYETTLDYTNKRTGREIITDICSKLGISLDGTFNFADYQFTQPNLENNVSYREVVSRIAELGGEIALINSNGKLVLKQQTNKDIVVERKHREEYSVEKEQEKIGRISLGFKGYDDDYVNGDNSLGSYTYRIENNPFAELVRAEIAPSIYENLKGKSIRKFEIKGLVDDVFLELNDKITLVREDGKTYSLVVLGLKNNGTFRTDVYAKVQEGAKANYRIAGSVKEDLKRVNLEVNHIKNEITSVVEDRNELGNKLVGLEQSINGFKTTVEQKNNELAEEFNRITQSIDGVKTELQSAGQDNLIYDSAFYSFANGNKQYSEYYTMAYVDENNTIIMPTWDDMTNYMKSKGVTTFRGGGTEDRRKQLIEDFPNIKRVEYSNNRWYARNNTTTNTKLEPIIVENSESKHGIVMKNNQVLQNFYINDSNSKYSLSYKLRKTNGVGRVYTRVRNLSKGEQAIDFMSDNRIVQGRENGIINLHLSANNTFGGNSGTNNMTSFWTKVVLSKDVKTILIPAGTYTIKGNVWRSGTNNRKLEFTYYLQSDLSTRKGTAWNTPNGVFSKVITINEPFYFDSIAWLDLSKTEPFSYTIENLRMEIGDTSAIGAVATTAFKDFPAGITVNEFTEFKFEELDLKEGINQFEIVTESGSEAEITDIMLTKTPKAIKWSPAVGETRNTNVNIGIEGISVHSVNTNNLTEMTPYGFNGYSTLNGKKEKMFGLSGDETFTKNLIASNEFRMPPFRLISITDGPKKGWALVKD